MEINVFIRKLCKKNKIFFFLISERERESEKKSIKKIKILKNPGKSI